MCRYINEQRKLNDWDAQPGKTIHLYFDWFYLKPKFTFQRKQFLCFKANDCTGNSFFFQGETENKDRLIIAEFPVSVLQLTSDASFICLWTSTIVQGYNDTKNVIDTISLSTKHHNHLQCLTNEKIQNITGIKYVLFRNKLPRMRFELNSNMFIIFLSVFTWLKCNSKKKERNELLLPRQ